MSARRRAALFGSGALACAVLAAAASGGDTSATVGLGELRPVAVARGELSGGTRIGAAQVRDAFEVKRVPAQFAPPDALATPAAAVGERLAIDLPAGSYLTGSALRPAASGRTRARGPAGTTPVEVPVVAAGALASGSAGAPLVDVVVASTPTPGPGSGRTYVAAERVQLLALSELPAEPGVPARWSATLALTRPQALELIRAEGLGRTIRLLGR